MLGVHYVVTPSGIAQAQQALEVAATTGELTFESFLTPLAVKDVPKFDRVTKLLNARKRIDAALTLDLGVDMLHTPSSKHKTMRAVGGVKPSGYGYGAR